MEFGKCFDSAGHELQNWPELKGMIHLYSMEEEESEPAQLRISDGFAGWSNPSEPTTDSAVPELSPLAAWPLFPPLEQLHPFALSHGKGGVRAATIHVNSSCPYK
ncbi:unnamed protein product [Prunus armeniaca]